MPEVYRLLNSNELTQAGDEEYSIVTRRWGAISGKFIGVEVCAFIVRRPLKVPSWEEVEKNLPCKDAGEDPCNNVFCEECTCQTILKLMGLKS